MWQRRVSAFLQCNTEFVQEMYRRLVERPRYGYGLALLILGYQIAACLHGFRGDPGDDLRNRIVGARALAAGLDPYDLRSLEAGGMPAPDLLDPFSMLYGFSWTTAPPTVLDLYRLFMHANWPIIRFFWAGAEWAALLGASALVIAATRPAQRRGLMALILAATVVAAPYWYNHLMCGQYYVYIAALLTIDMILIWRGDHRYAGYATGLAITLRPPVLLFAPVLWLAGRRRAALSASGVGLALLFASMTIQAPAWTAFSQYTDRLVNDYTYGPSTPISASNVANFPAVVAAAAKDGVDESQFAADLAAHHTTLTIGGHKPSWPIWLGHGHWQLGLVVLQLLILAGAGITAWRVRSHSEPFILLLGWLPTLIDIASPIQNYYNEIFYLPGIAAVALVALRERRVRPEILLGLLALASCTQWLDPVRPKLFHGMMLIMLWTTSQRGAEPPVDSPTHTNLYQLSPPASPPARREFLSPRSMPYR